MERKNNKTRIPELLSPAGDRAALSGALAAGADAVYLGGNRFGARAYAENFSDEALLDALRLVHLHGRKLYLTVNILIRESELQEAEQFLLRPVQAGLDGVIVQDLGLIRRLSHRFPGLHIHASTQLSVTEPAGASLLRDAGVRRIVPARELSLAEIAQIGQSGVETEVFLHGAMCYSYSGNCLFSSMLGDRSGNRGRCAGPCRLPYRMEATDRECYPLSMRDLCGADVLPQLVSAGVRSLKIEGRMKKPEYAAGVTECYRILLDRLETLSGEEGTEVSPAQWQEDPVYRRERERLRRLYLRSETGTGYYLCRNGRETVSLDSPAYSPTDDAVLEDVRARFLTEPPRIPVRMMLEARVDEPVRLTLTTVAQDGTPVSVQTEEGLCQAARNRGMSEMDIAGHLDKLGGSSFRAEKLQIQLAPESENGVFIPVRTLNELRRRGVTLLEEALLQANGYPPFRMAVEQESGRPGLSEGIREGATRHPVTGRLLQVCVRNAGQLSAVVRVIRQQGPDKCPIGRLYVETGCLRQPDAGQVFSALLEMPGRPEIYVALPYILREDARGIGESSVSLTSLLRERGQQTDGLLVRTLGELALAASLYREGIPGAGSVVTDYGLYAWNHETLQMLGELSQGDVPEAFCAPLELTSRELENLLDGMLQEQGMILQVYGRAPMMLTANCIRHTSGHCPGQASPEQAAARLVPGTELTDRKGQRLPISVLCDNCMNIVWNSVPTSIHRHLSGVLRGRLCPAGLRVDLSTETPEETEEILGFWTSLLAGGDGDPAQPPYETYTNGHFRTGVN
ncbi:MAG: U32 family peptidase [Butyrivibrio sp.]|nr:U32 family peptidase [Butyrivibrio sp.]